MADLSSVREKVIDIIAERLDVDKSKITDETSFIDDLEADSLDTAELVMEFEEEFGIEIPETEEGIKTVGDAIKYIEEKIKEKNNG